MFRFFPRVATDGAGYLVTWHESTARGPALLAARIDADGKRLDEPFVTVTRDTPHPNSGTAAAVHPGAYVVAWVNGDVSGTVKAALLEWPNVSPAVELAPRPPRSRRKWRRAVQARTRARARASWCCGAIRKLELEKVDLEALLQQTRHERDRWRVLYNGLRRKAEARGEVMPPPPLDEVEAIEQARKAFGETLILPNDMIVDTDLGPDLYDALNAMHDAVLRERSRKTGDRQKMFSELFGKHLNHPARYEPGNTGLQYHGEKERDRVHIRSGKPEDTESVYWLERGTVDKRQYLIVQVGRHAP